MTGRQNFGKAAFFQRAWRALFGIAFLYDFIFVFFLGIQESQATEIFENYMSARALGMGNAYSAVVDDKDALFFNPAGLNRIHGIHLTVLDPAIGTDSATAYQTYQDATGSSYSNLIHQFYGKQVWVGIQDSLAYSMRDFAVEAYDFFNLSFVLHNPAYSNLTFSITNDYGLVGGGSTSLTPNDAVRVGVAFKRVTRYGGRVPFGPSTLATLSNSALLNLINNIGTGYGADAGLLIEVPSAAKPTFAFTWHDIGQTSFYATAGSNAPPPMLNNPVFGYAMTFDFPGGSLKPALDFQHMTEWNEQLGKKFHLGLELQLPGVSVRGGVNQGYYTAGVGVDLKYLRVDAATYGVELDTYPGQLEDRRYVVQATLDFNFDINFSNAKNNSTGSAAPRSSYQRR